MRGEADAAHTARETGVPRGAVSQLPSLDRELSGAFSPGCHFLHGNAGTGKTALAWQIAQTCGVPCLFVTCEMGPVEMLRRLTARSIGIYLGRLKSGEMLGADVEAAARRAVEATPYLALLDATQYAAPTARLHQCAEVTRRLANGTHAEGKLLIVVDSLHSWAGRVSSELAGAATEYETLNAAVASLQALTSQLNCPALIISERNRDSMKSGGLNAGAGTRKIEYGGETVIDLDRDSDAQEDGAGEIPVTLRLAKNRNGSAGRRIPLMFHGALQKFRESDGAATGNGGTKATSRRVA